MKLMQELLVDRNKHTAIATNATAMTNETAARCWWRDKHTTIATNAAVSVMKTTARTAAMRQTLQQFCAVAATAAMLSSGHSTRNWVAATNATAINKCYRYFGWLLQGLLVMQPAHNSYFGWAAARTAAITNGAAAKVLVTQQTLPLYNKLRDCCRNCWWRNKHAAISWRLPLFPDERLLQLVIWKQTFNDFRWKAGADGCYNKWAAAGAGDATCYCYRNKCYRYKWNEGPAAECWWQMKRYRYHNKCYRYFRWVYLETGWSQLMPAISDEATARQLL
jgi:hypothetical protein